MAERSGDEVLGCREGLEKEYMRREMSRGGERERSGSARRGGGGKREKKESRAISF